MPVSEASQLATLNADFVRLIKAHNRPAVDDKGRRENGIAAQLDERRSEHRHFLELLEALPAAVYATDAAGRIIFYNGAAAELWGLRPELGKSEWCGSWRLYWPDGRPMPHDQCPMAVALKERRPFKGTEAMAERPDGTRVPFLAYPTPLIDETGTLIGAVNMLVDITERKRAEHDGQLLASIVESSDDAIVSKNLNGIITSWNKGAERLFGYAAGEIVGKPITILIPSDRLHEETRILELIRRGERIEHYETVRQRKDGTLVEISLTVSPIKSADGRVIGASKIARDITERRRAQEQQTLLLREMSHRVKNLFAVASGVVTLSARSASTPNAMAKAIRDRLGALTRAHDLTRPGLIDTAEKCSRDTTLHALARTIFSPYLIESEDHERVSLNGPELPIGGSAVTSLALLLHEFATNAAKYGALASPSGCVRVDWSAEKDEFALTWKERGGPPVDGQPQCEGFGSLLAHRIVVGQFGGRLFHDWKPEGLTIHLSLPIEQLTK
jgi:PAS domain S-box-containing protein